METERLKQIKVHAQAIAELLYEETDSEKVKTLEGVESLLVGNKVRKEGKERLIPSLKRVILVPKN